MVHRDQMAYYPTHLALSWRGRVMDDGSWPRTGDARCMERMLQKSRLADPPVIPFFSCDNCEWTILQLSVSLMIWLVDPISRHAYILIVSSNPLKRV